MKFLLPVLSWKDEVFSAFSFFLFTSLMKDDGQLETHSPSKVPTLPLKSKGIGKGVQWQAQVTPDYSVADSRDHNLFSLPVYHWAHRQCLSTWIQSCLKMLKILGLVCTCVSVYVPPCSYREHLKLRLRINNSGQLPPQGKNLSPKADYSRLDFCLFGFFQEEKSAMSP